MLELSHLLEELLKTDVLTWLCSNKFSALQAASNVIVIPDLIQNAPSTMNNDGSTVAAF